MPRAILASLVFMVFSLTSTALCGETEQMRESAIQVCAGILSYLQKQTPITPEDRQLFKLRIETLDKIADSELLEISNDTTTNFLVQIIAKGTVMRRADIKPDRRAPLAPRVHSKELVLQKFGNESKLPLIEHSLMFSQGGSYGYNFELIAKIRSPKSLPFLESFYDWQPRRLSDSQSVSPVRRIIAKTIASYHTELALKSLSQLWNTLAQTAEDKRDLVRVVAVDWEWQKLIASLSIETRESAAKYLAAVKAEADKNSRENT